MNDPLTYNFKSRDASASKKDLSFTVGSDSTQLSAAKAVSISEYSKTIEVLEILRV